MSPGRLACSQLKQALRTMVSSHGRASPSNPPKKRKARSIASWSTSSASWSLRVSQRARLYAASICGSTCCSKRSRSLKIGSCYAHLAAHLLVTLAAEDVAHEVEAAALLRGEGEPRHLAGHDVGAEVQLRHVEAHEHICRRELEDDRLPFLQRQHIRCKAELARADAHDPGGLLRQRADAERGERSARQRAQEHSARHTF